MAQAPRYLRAFGIFSAGSLVTYSALNFEKLTKKDIAPTVISEALTNDNKVVKQINSSQTNFEGKTITKVLENEQVVERISRPNIEHMLTTCRQKIEAWKAQSCVPGLVVGVSIKGKPVWAYASGLADIENDVKCTEKTVMRIASISKSITSAYLMKMVEANLLDLDKPIRYYLTKDQFPDKAWNGENVDITLRQLAAHTAGIRNYKEVDSKDWQSAEFLSSKAYETAVDSLKIFKDDPLIAKPGTKYSYTTFGWTLISAVMESQLPKKNFGQAFQKFISTELGLRHTKLDQNLPIIANRSKYYFLKDNRLMNVPPVDNSCKWAGGGLVSNVGDLLQFGNLILYSHITGNLPGFFSREQIDEMWRPLKETLINGDNNNQPKFDGYGIGWVSVVDGKAKVAFGPEARFDQVAYHTGAAVGASSVLLIEPRKEIVVAIITNLQQVNPLSVAQDLAKEFSELK